MTSLTDVFVTVKPDMDKFGPEVKRKLNAIDSKKEGKQVATRFGVGMNGAMGGIVSRSAGIFAAGFALIKGAQIFTGFINDARESAKVARISAQVVKSTGSAAKITAGQMGALATAISNKTGADDEAIQSGENLLATFTNVRNETGKGNKIFDRATQAAVDMAAAMNNGVVDANGLKSANIQLGKALNDPIKGVTALTKVGVSFTKQQKDQIKSLVESGDTLGAQKIILAEVGKEFGGAAEAATDPLTKLHTIVGNVSETIGGAFLPIVDKAATWLGENLPGAVATAGKFFNEKLLPPLSAVAGFFTDEIIPAVEDTIAAFAGLGKKLVKAIGPIDLSGIATGIFNDTKAWAGSVIGGLKSGVESGDWKPLGKSLGDGVIAAVQNLGAKAGAILDAVGDLIDKVDWGALGTKISGGILGMLKAVDWGKLGGTLGDALVTVVQKSTTLGEKLGEAFKEIVDKVNWQQIGHDSTDAIGQFISGVDWGKVAKTFGIVLLKSLKVADDVKGAIVNASRDLVLGIGDAIIDEMSVQRLKLVAWTKRIGGDLISGLWGGIKGAMKGVGGFIKSVVVDPIINWAKSLFGIHSPSTVFASIGVQLIAGLRAGIVAGARSIGGFISRTVIAPAVAAFSRAGSWLVQYGRNFVAGFKNGVTAIAKSIGRWMSTNVISPVTGAFGKAGTWLVQAGKNVIAGFKNGMAQIWTDVTKWVGGIATWIKDHKGPVSLDGRLLVPAGRAIMSGFLTGLKSGAGKAWDFVSSVGGKTKDALAAVFGGPFMGGGGPAPGNLSAMQALVRTVAAQRGWGSGPQWDALYQLVQHESGFNPNAQNPTSSAYGLFQFLNSTWGSVGASKTSDPWAQTAAGLRYISNAYGSPMNAWSKWLSRSPHWYAKGTPWVPNDQLAYVHRGEGIIPADVNRQLLAAGSGGGTTVVQLSEGDRTLLRRVEVAIERLAGRPLVLDARSFDAGMSRTALSGGYR